MALKKLDRDEYNNLLKWREKLLQIIDEENPNDIRDIKQRIIAKFDRCFDLLVDLRREYNRGKEVVQMLREEEAGLRKAVAKSERIIEQHRKDMEKAKSNILYTPEEQRKVVNKYWRIQKNLQKEADKVEEKQKELIIKQEELVQAIEDTELAKSSYYRLSPKEREIFEVDRPKILAALEQHGTLAAALKADKSIKSTLPTVMYYAEKHPAFKTDLNIAKQIFKENLDTTILDRAINGTENPVFQKGEYIGDYKVKDNKLLMEVAKANIPEKYDRKTYAAEHPKVQTNNTVNIISYENVDETKHGYTKNVGLVTNVDDTGKVKRIMQQDKLLEHYKDNPNVEVVIPEVIDEHTDD